MLKKLSILLLFVTVGLSPSCHDIEEWDNTLSGNFLALWTIIDEHYCFFEEKDIDWDEVKTRYGRHLYSGMNSRQLFDLCADMINELQDGHVNLSSSFNTSYYREWWSLYPENFDLRLVQEYYLNFDYRQLGEFSYAILPENIGYVLVPSFESELGESNLDAIFSYFALCTAVIIDVRDNGGGQMTAAEGLIRRFLSQPIVAGYMINKTGAGHSDFSEPKAFTYDACDADRVPWSKDVVVITNRSTFSAANHFVGVMRTLPQCTVVGATTGGGSGMPLSMELPCGWSVRLSAVSVLDPEGNVTEQGIDPTPGCEVDLDAEQALNGIDTMLEFAIDVAMHGRPASSQSQQNAIKK